MDGLERDENDPEYKKIPPGSVRVCSMTKIEYRTTTNVSGLRIQRNRFQRKNQHTRDTKKSPMHEHFLLFSSAVDLLVLGKYPRNVVDDRFLFRSWASRSMWP